MLQGRPRASFRRQLAALSGRAARNARRHPALIAVNWGATAVVAAGLGAQRPQLARPPPNPQRHVPLNTTLWTIQKRLRQADLHPSPKYLPDSKILAASATLIVGVLAVSAASVHLPAGRPEEPPGYGCWALVHLLVGTFYAPTGFRLCHPPSAEPISSSRVPTPPEMPRTSLRPKRRTGTPG